MTDLSWIGPAFALANSLRALSFVPQILAVARSTDGARDIALVTWSIWTATNLLGVAYGAVVAADGLLALSFAASALACGLTIALTVVKRLRFRAARRAALSPRPASGSAPTAPRAAAARPVSAASPRRLRAPSAARARPATPS